MMLLSREALKVYQRVVRKENRMSKKPAPMPMKMPKKKGC